MHYIMYQRIEKNAGFNLVHCFLISLIGSRRYPHFTNGTPNHCCQSLNIIAHSYYSIKFCDRQVFLSDMRMIQMILSTK